MRRSTVGVLLVTCIAACVAEEKKAQAPVTAAPNVVMLSSANDTFQAPDTIAAGWTTLRFANNGDDLHYAHIVRLDSGRTATELVDAYAEAIRTSGPRPKWLTRVGGPGGAPPGGASEVTQFLEPGSYVWICPIEDDKGNPHFGKGEVRPFVVSGSAERTAGPTASVVIRLQDFSFTIDSSLRSGTHTIRVENAGVEPHDLALLKLVPGKTMEDVQAFLNPERARRPGQADQPPPPLESLVTPVAGIAAIAPGMEVFFDVNVTPGEYVVVCFATAPDGRSHIEHGMIQQLRIQ